jgi:hypothetical protein
VWKGSERSWLSLDMTKGVAKSLQTTGVAPNLRTFFSKRPPLGKTANFKLNSQDTQNFMIKARRELALTHNLAHGHFEGLTACLF